MKKIFVGTCVLLLSLPFFSCDLFGNLDLLGGDERPDIPKPESYIAEVPLVSEELILATVPLTDFSPLVVNAKNAAGNYVTADIPAGERVSLVVNGNPAQNPVFHGFAVVPLAESPQIQFVRYWRRLGEAEHYASATTTTVSRSTTHGTSSTSTESFGFTVGVETTVSTDAIFASASLTVKAEFGAEWETEVTITEEQTVTETYEVSVGQDENLVFCMWQLVDEYRIVTQIDGEWVPYADANYIFTEETLDPLVVPVNEFRKISYRFDNTPRK